MWPDCHATCCGIEQGVNIGLEKESPSVSSVVVETNSKTPRGQLVYLRSKS